MKYTSINNGGDDVVSDADECHEGKFNGQGCGQTMAGNCVPHAATAAAAAAATAARNLQQYEMLIRLLVSRGFEAQSQTQTRMPIKTLNAYWKK